MVKPLVSSTFLTFPKFLVWGLPLLLVLGYTWVIGRLDSNILLQIPIIIKFLQTEVERWPGSTAPIYHDESFTPDFILRVTEQEFTQSCITKPNVLLINGTTPGPLLRLTEGNIYWIRVFNDMDSQNLTMVLIPKSVNPV